MKIEMPLTLDVVTECSPFDYIAVKRGDNESRVLAVSLTCMGRNFGIPEDISAELRCKKPDGTATITAGNISDNKIYIELTQNTLAAPGDALCELQLTKDTEVLTTVNFSLRILENALTDEEIISKDEFTSIKTEILKSLVIDDLMSDTSENVVQNKVIKKYVDDKVGDLNGSNGNGGYTPVKGVDYYTEEEKQELADEITEEVTGNIEPSLTEINTKLASKADKEEIPTAVSELENDRNYVTKDVVGDIDTLATDDKSNLTNAVNEIVCDMGDFDNIPDPAPDIAFAIGTIQTNMRLKADKATTLGEYGITDAYTKTEVDNFLSAKVSNDVIDGILTMLSLNYCTKDDVYTKTEVDSLINAVIGSALEGDY